METIVFDKNTKDKTIVYTEKPILYIGNIIFQSSDKDWHTRLSSVNLIIKTTCIKNSDSQSNYQEIINLGSFIIPTRNKDYHMFNMTIGIGGTHQTPYSNKQININRFIHYGGSLDVQQAQDCEEWRVDMELSGLEMQDTEELKVELMDSQYIKKRVDNWIDRVNTLFNEITQWYSNNSSLSVRLGRPVMMYEELMQNFHIPSQSINTINIYKKNTIILSFKPIGLWVIGANGRIDVLSSKGNFLLLDQAEQFQLPKWKIYPKTNKIRGEIFNETSLNKLIASLG